MTVRITQRLMTQRSLTALQTGLGRLADSQEKLSTGRAINRPSDSPTGTNEAMRLRAQIAADGQYTTNGNDGLSWLGDADSTLTSMLDSVRQARDLLVQGSSTGSNDANARAALATELDQIREGLIGQANTEHLGRPLFGGTTGKDAAYTRDTDGNVKYAGDPGVLNRRVGEDDLVPVNVTGPDAFHTVDANGNDIDLFSVLKQASADLRGNPAGLANDLDSLDAVSKQMTTALSNVGARYQRIQTSLDQLSSRTLDNKTALSNVENVDIANAVVDLQMQEVAYQASLGATSRVLQPSLLDFLK